MTAVVGRDLIDVATRLFSNSCRLANFSISQQFAIRPTIRNHNVMKRDDVIKIVADVVGPLHSVDLKNFDLLILVEIYRVSRIFDIFSTYCVHLERHG